MAAEINQLAMNTAIIIYPKVPKPGSGAPAVRYGSLGGLKKGCCMTKPIERDRIYRKRWFDAEVFVLCVRWYISYRLTYRDLVEMMAERGVSVVHTTILRWTLRFVPEFEKHWDRFRRRVGGSWRTDETYISVRGQWHC